MGIWDKLLQDRGLAALDASPLQPARAVDSDRTTPPLSSLDLTSRLDKASKQTGHHKAIASELAWRCSNCDTINTLVANKPIVRKTCSKCKRNRTGIQTVRDEISELKMLEDLKKENEVETVFDKVTEDLL